jgi:o-succinylbenzoate synthase
LNYSLNPYQLQFLFEAKTSRNTFKTRDILLLDLIDESGGNFIGKGEIAPLKRLSPETLEDCSRVLGGINLNSFLNKAKLDQIPSSLIFGLEMALQNLKYGKENIFFEEGLKNLREGIKINGLIWMGDREIMFEQAREKIRQGYRCIKVKIGGIRWADELELIEFIRKEGGKDCLIRLDANGAFGKEEFVEKWEDMDRLNVHSVEQPLPVNNWSEMSQLSQQYGIPIALDEELTGISDEPKKREVLEMIQPKFIVLKPTLHGGFSGTKNWIEVAGKLDIQWWITSALESNLGLSAIAQFVASFNNPLAQGLGTGALYSNNFPSPLKLDGDQLKWED